MNPQLMMRSLRPRTRAGGGILPLHRDTESEEEANDDQRKASRTSRGRLPAPSGRACPDLLRPLTPLEALRQGQVARTGPRASSRRRTPSLARRQSRGPLNHLRSTPPRTASGTLRSPHLSDRSRPKRAKDLALPDKGIIGPVADVAVAVMGGAPGTPTAVGPPPSRRTGGGDVPRDRREAGIGLMADGLASSAASLGGLPVQAPLLWVMFSIALRH